MDVEKNNESEPNTTHSLDELSNKELDAVEAQILKEYDNSSQRNVLPPVNKLNKREFRAIEMRYFGKTSQEIAKATGYNDVYVRNLFMKGGRLEKAYEDFALKQRSEAQKSVDMALNRAREEALQAIERIIALSKDADNEAAIFKANEFLLNVAGIKSEVSLRSFFQNKTYEQARKLVDELFNDLFGQNVTHPGFQVVIQQRCPKCNPRPESPMSTTGETAE